LALIGEAEALQAAAIRQSPPSVVRITKYRGLRHTSGRFLAERRVEALSLNLSKAEIVPLVEN
jgi:hypothetical protein